ncbi:MAG: hypothetical protein DRG11_05445 [Epsilonproteobacteria bacterium]|nr:MAG: hypothetical protein DRG11_05445 [Campylobacterota bacterium]
MNILIIEEQMHLSHEISTNLIDTGYNCIEKKSLSIKSIKFNIVILSISSSKLDYEAFIKTNKNKHIILLCDIDKTKKAIELLSCGADIFLTKPINMKLLLTKVNLYKEYFRVKENEKQHTDTLQFLFRTQKPYDKPYTFPLQLCSQNTICADFIAFDIAKKENKTLKLIQIKKDGKPYKLNNFDFENYIPYITDISNLSETKKDRYMQYLSQFKVVVYIDQKCKQYPKFECIKIKTLTDKQITQDILTIDGYIKYILNKFQDNLNDTSIASSLSISRKTLWNKRKKLGVCRP